MLKKSPDYILQVGRMVVLGAQVGSCGGGLLQRLGSPHLLPEGPDRGPAISTGHGHLSPFHQVCPCGCMPITSRMHLS